ncbi:class A beta-lactamase [Paraburkholderia phymatum]|uniref:beta-lactamase n=1 Tax=Paraburkholderia phymatum (strain DSM 17167 / CIP 108236 / LMG 21445 / STM815) TaxID=391038 RepID=B2JHB5_PARP8|nr:class A beta-lactamase [Paraburkholderia phymatum]ACC70353.1 Beta-lactamase [Paraburkholderia phymatum STM815]
MVTRRAFTIALGGGLAGIAVQAFGTAAAASAQGRAAHGGALDKRFAQIEAETGGRLGVAILDTANGQLQGWRARERFPMCSTFKFLLASAVLMRKDQGKEQLGRRIVYAKDAVVANSPVSGPRAGGDGMTVSELCEAALTRSDNTAANLLLESIGGPPALTVFARGIGDGVTRLDRNEPTLNEAIEGDPRDTTTPAAMIADMRAMLLGEHLSAASRQHLTVWLVANKTGDTRLRAGLPPDWRVGDKTGTGERGTSNDIAIVWPAGRPPVLVAVYLTGATQTSAAQRDAAIAKVGALVAHL